MSKKDVLHGAAKKLNDFNPECFKGPKLLQWKAHCKKVKTKAFMMRCLTELETIRSFRKHLATLDPKFKPIRDRWKDCLPPPDHVNRGSHALLTIMLTGGVSDVNVIPHLEPTVKGRGFDLSFQKIDSMPLIQFCRIIRRYSIWAVNGIKIKKAARHILHNHRGKLPRDISSLMSIYGVGHKMASLMIEATYGVNTAISVDRHVFRSMRVLKWVDVPNKSGQPEASLQAMQWVPQEQWMEVNDLLGGLCQLIRQNRHEIIALAKLHGKGTYTVVFKIAGTTPGGRSPLGVS
jgi:endonuclease III